MATKKKPKTKAKKAKKAKKTATRKAKAAKRITRKPAPKKAAPKKKKTAVKAAKKKPAPKKPVVAAKKRKPAPKRPVIVAKAPAPAVPPGEERIGIVTHYFSHLMVAIVKLEVGSMTLGDVVHIKGHTSDFTQTVDSLEVEHVHVDKALAGQSFGMRVKEHAREHDIVYKKKV
jgi:hypothetical protein